jgi:NAD-dependent dihydropyrimidine dehydrogenase PreA subunit
MVRIDSTRCNVCGKCVEICPQRAITIGKGTAVVNQELCIECGACAKICPTGAIQELIPANTKSSGGSDKMVYGYGRGFGVGFGRRGGAGFGFRGDSPAWPYVGRGRGGLPRCWYPGLWGAVPYPTTAPYWSAPTHEEEMGFLKNQADMMKQHLGEIERRIQELEKKD